MAYAFVASVGAGSADQQSVTTGSINTTGADFIVLVSSYHTVFGANNNPSDSKTNTWTGLGEHVNTDDSTLLSIQVFYCKSPSVGSGHTFSVTSSGNFNKPALIALAFSGGATSTLDLDVATKGQSFPTETYPGGSGTPASSGELVIAATTLESNDTPPATSTFGSAGPTVTFSAFTTASAVNYDIQTTASAVNVTWNSIWEDSDANARAMSVLASFNAPAAGKRFFLIPN